MVVLEKFFKIYQTFFRFIWLCSKVSIATHRSKLISFSPTIAPYFKCCREDLDGRNEAGGVEQKEVWLWCEFKAISIFYIFDQSGILGKKQNRWFFEHFITRKKLSAGISTKEMKPTVVDKREIINLHLLKHSWLWYFQTIRSRSKKQNQLLSKRCLWTKEFCWLMFYRTRSNCV